MPDLFFKPAGPRRGGVDIFKIASRVFTALALLVCLASAGCESMIGSRVVQAPNQGLSVREIGCISEKMLTKTGVSREMRINVGPPAASLSVWVFEPNRKTIRVNMDRFISQKVSWRFTQADRPAREDDQPLGTILVLHGIYDCNEGYGGIWGSIFAAAGYRAILVDMRGQGRSTGDWLTFGVQESRDVSQVIDALVKQNRIAGKIGVFGISYGAAVAIETAALDPRIEAVTSVAAFSSMNEVVPTFGKRYISTQLGDFTWKLVEGLVPGVIREAGRAGKFDPAAANPKKAIALTDAPVLLIHGTKDAHVPVQQAEELLEASSPRSRLVLMSDDTHLSLALKRVSSLRSLSLEWFDRYLAPTQSNTVKQAKAEGKG